MPKTLALKKGFKIQLGHVTEDEISIFSFTIKHLDPSPADCSLALFCQL